MKAAMGLLHKKQSNKNVQSILVLKGHSQAVHWCCFIEDGKKIISASEDHTIKIWDAPLFSFRKQENG